MHCNLRTAAPSDHSHTANRDTKGNLCWNGIKFMNINKNINAHVKLKQQISTLIYNTSTNWHFGCQKA